MSANTNLSIMKKLAAMNTEIYELTEKIREHLYDCNNPENNWGHVGSTAHILDILNHVARFMDIEQREADNGNNDN